MTPVAILAIVRHMKKTTRRDALKSLVVGGAAVATTSAQAAKPKDPQDACAATLRTDWSDLRWGKGFEGQRIADLGDGTFLNPVFAGDRPDPTILKDGDDYYMTFSSFDSYPGIVDLAFARSRELERRGSGADQARRFGVGLRPRQTRRPLLHLLPGAHARPGARTTWSCAVDARAVERAHRSETAGAHRSRAHRRRRRQAIPVPLGWRSRAAHGRRAGDRWRRSSTSTIRGGIPTTGSWRASRPKGRRSCGTATSST